MGGVPQSNDELPLVTAVVTTYARAELAKRAISSVFDQTYRPLQIIVVEDGSISDLRDWLSANNDVRAEYICHETNRGLAAARNTALRQAKGQFIAYLDDDDLWKPERVEKQVDLVRHLTPDAFRTMGVVSTGFERIIPWENRTTYAPPGNVGNLRDAILREGAKTPSSTFLFKADALRDVGGFDEKLVSSIDHDIWMALAAKGYDAYAVDEALVINYDRQGQATMMGSTEKRIAGVTQFVKKWTPTLRGWLGESQGEAFMNAYYAKVIGNLAVGKLFEGQLRDAYIAACSIYKQSHRWVFTSFVLLRYFVIGLARRVLPRPGLARMLRRG